MPSIAGIDLETDDPAVIAGAVFLTAPDNVGDRFWTSESLTTVPVDGHRVRIAGRHAVYVSLLDGSYGPYDTMAACFEIAQRALDLEAAHGEAALSLRRGDEQHIYWWREEEQVVLRIVITRPLQASTRASSGHIQRYFDATTGKGKLPTWGPGLRFFRLYQLSTDVFEAYRNAFLALEALLDTDVPPGAPDGEGNWLRFALTHVPARHNIDLTHYLVGQLDGDPVEQFLAEQYKARRCALFHAKSTKGSVLLPGVAADRRSVSEALQPLVRVVLGLIRGIHHIIFPSGGMVIGGFLDVIRNLQTYGYAIAILDDPEPSQPRDRHELETLGLQQLATSYVGPLDAVGLEQLFASELNESDLNGGAINTVATYTEPHPEGLMHMPSTANGLLSRTALPVVNPEASLVEIHVRWVLDNLTMPKSRFPH